MTVINFPNAMKLARILDKPELSSITATSTQEDFVLALFDVITDEELEQILALVFGDKLIDVPENKIMSELVTALVETGYFQLMETYRGMNGQ